MRLMEFVFSVCDENNGDYSEDTFDEDLKKFKKKRSRPTREIIAEIDSRYEVARKKDQTILVV